MIQVVDISTFSSTSSESTALGTLETVDIRVQISPVILRDTYPNLLGAGGSPASEIITLSLLNNPLTLWVGDLTITPQNTTGASKIALTTVAPSTGNADSNSLIIDGTSSDLFAVDTIITGATGSVPPDLVLQTDIL